MDQQILKSPSSLEYFSYGASKFGEESACGKAIIVGEHAVVHGSKAVALPLKNLRMNLSLNAKEDSNGYHSVLESKEKVEASFFDFSMFLKQACRLLGVKFEPLRVKATSDILIGSGLGSSAALCVSLIKLLSIYYEKNLSLSRVAELANKLEHTFHGTPSGLDTSIIAFEKPIIFQKNKEPVFLDVKPVRVNSKTYPWPFVLIDTTERMPTYLMVEKTSRYFRGSEGKKRIELFNKFSDMASDSFKSGNIRMMSEAMNRTANLLEELGVATELSCRMSSMIRKVGAYAVKITGSGGGGCLLALLDPNRSEEQYQSLVDLFGENRIFNAHF